jgi:phosphoserine phosphatase
VPIAVSSPGRMVDQPWGDICDGAEKRRMLLETCAALGISPKQAIAMGDGANDLPMMGEAGLSVAYHAKPKVREQAMVAIHERRPGPPARSAALIRAPRGLKPRAGSAP